MGRQKFKCGSLQAGAWALAINAHVTALRCKQGRRVQLGKDAEAGTSMGERGQSMALLPAVFHWWLLHCMRGGGGLSTWHDSSFTNNISHPKACSHLQEHAKSAAAAANAVCSYTLPDRPTRQDAPPAAAGITAVIATRMTNSLKVTCHTLLQWAS